MTAAPALGAALALFSAFVWGSGDFAGGLAARRADPLQVLAWSAASGVVLLVALAVVTHEAVLPLTAGAWAVAAGISGAVGITCLYRGLAVGRAATVAPVAAVVTAALPVIFSAVTIGLPKPIQIFGFVVAIVGIWLVAKTPDPPAEAGAHLPTAGGLALALAAGTGFGGFLILIARVPLEFVFLPLTIARMTMLVVAAAALLARGMALPSPRAHPIALLAGALDAGGNVFYIIARRYARLDVVAVLSSLYPVATVLLAWLILRERIDRRQWAGAAVCCTAIGLIVG